MPAASSNLSEELGRLQKKLDSWQKFAVSGRMPCEHVTLWVYLTLHCTDSLGPNCQ